MIWKYSKLVYLPILAVGFMHVKNRYLAINNGRYWAINSYLAAICLTCILTFLKSKGLIHLHPEWDQSAVFYNYIITGFMVSFGSYIAGLYFFQSKSWWSKSVYLCIWLLTSFHILFINSGRTGHILYIVLMLLLITQTLSFKQSLLGFVIFTCVLCLCYQHSQVMHNGVNLFLTEIKLLKQNDKASSLGHRIQFHNYAKSLFVQHPIAGIGTGGFRQQFYLDNPVPSWGKEITEPHSQYWMTMVEQGTIGIVLLLMFLASLLLTSLKLKETRSLLIGIFVAFCIGSFSDTILCFSAAGYLLIVISALGFGELLEHTDYVPNRFTFKTILLR
jgi:O-antigen ligase